MKNGEFIFLSDPVKLSDAAKLVKVLPLGSVKSRKGVFTVDALSFKEMYSYYKERGIDIVVDYEHQTLENVQAPASGWVKELLLKDDGVYAEVEWTDKAKEYIDNKEYRYLSPVIYRRKTDSRAVVFQSMALTNTPAIDAMEPIVNSMSLDFEGGQDEMEFLKKMAKALGLAEDATEEQVLEALALAMKPAEQEPTEVVASKAVLEALALKDDAGLADVTGAIMALKNPAGHVTVEAFNDLKKKIESKEGADLVQMALTAGKITPAQKPWADEMALKDPAGFNKFVELAPVVVPLDEISGGITKKATAGTEMSVNKMLGVSAEDLEKYGKDDE